MFWWLLVVILALTVVVRNLILTGAMGAEEDKVHIRGFIPDWLLGRISTQPITQLQ